MGYLLAENEESLFVQPQQNLSLSTLALDIRILANSNSSLPTRLLWTSLCLNVLGTCLSLMSQTVLIQGSFSLSLDSVQAF